jgi:IS30 family transposase
MGIERIFREEYGRQGQIVDAVSITFVATLVERQSRDVMLVRLPSKDTSTVTRAITRRIRRRSNPNRARRFVKP